MIGINDYRTSIIQRLLGRNNDKDTSRCPMLCKALVVRSDSKNLIIARDFSGQLAHDCGFTADAVFEIKLAVSEALSNAILHGSPRGCKSIVRLAFLCDNYRLSITITDEGAFGHLPRNMSSSSEGGRGLKLIARYMDTFSIKPTALGTRVTLVKIKDNDNEACA
ncbi:MAG: ATP-binding protein [Actinomycetota bacterium]|nr:ATP-binding protein [Actinomycetota bacterium]